MSPWIDTSLRDLAMEWLVGEWIDTYEIDIKNDIETCIISCMKRVTSPGSMHNTGCLGLCTGTTQRDGMGREEGGGFRMGNTCIPVADSFQYLAKPIQYCKV